MSLLRGRTGQPVQPERRVVERAFPTTIVAIVHQQSRHPKLLQRHLTDRPRPDSGREHHAGDARRSQPHADAGSRDGASAGADQPNRHRRTLAQECNDRGDVRGMRFTHAKPVGHAARLVRRRVEDRDVEGQRGKVRRDADQEVVRYRAQRAITAGQQDQARHRVRDPGEPDRLRHAGPRRKVDCVLCPGRGTDHDKQHHHRQQPRRSKRA